MIQILLSRFSFVYYSDKITSYDLKMLTYFEIEEQIIKTCIIV